MHMTHHVVSVVFFCEFECAEKLAKIMLKDENMNKGRVEMIVNLAFMCDNLNAKGIPEYLIQFVWETKLISAKSFL